MKNLVLVTEEIYLNDMIFSGQGSIVFYLIKYLRQLYNIGVITIKFKGQKEEELLDNVKVVRVSSRLSAQCSDFKDFFSQRTREIDKSYLEFKDNALKHIIKTYSVQRDNTIIFLHYGYATGSFCKKLRLAGFKVIIMCHSFRLERYLKSLFASDFVDLQYDLTNFSLIQRTLLKLITNIFGNEIKFLNFFSLFYKLNFKCIIPLKIQIYYENEIESLRYANRIMVLSNGMKDYIVKNNPPYVKDKIEIISTGISEESFREIDITNNNYIRHIFNIEKDEIILLFIGRINPMKGLEYFLESLLKIEKSQRLIDKKIKAIIVGAAYGVYELYLRRLISMSKNLNTIKVLFSGPIYGKEKIALYDLSTIFILPSVYEPFGLVVLEAMARGKPVIISNNCGVKEVIDERFSMIVNYNKPRERSKNLSETIEAVLRMDLKSMGMVAREEAKKYAWQRVISEYDNLFNIVDQKRGVNINQNFYPQDMIYPLNSHYHCPQRK